MARSSHGRTRTKRLLPVFLALLIGLFVHRLLCAGRGAPVHEFVGATMGTRYSVKVATPVVTPAARAQIAAAVQAHLDEVERLMSTYDPESELSRFNRHPAGEPFRVSPATLEVFRVAWAVSERSGGALDATVAPLVEAWGFGASAQAPEPPGAAELAKLRARVGYRRVAIDLASGTVTKTAPGIACDLSAVAKGYAVDRVTDALSELGYADFLVEVGGELRARGRKGPQLPWRVAVETPDPASRRIQRVIELEDRAMATSGDYRNFYEQEGVWISHLIDPRTARPIEHGLASVTVLHRDAAWADAWATALIVLGPQGGYEVAQREGLAAYFIARAADGELAARATPGFEALAERTP